MKTFEQFVNETPDYIYQHDLTPFSKDSIAFSYKVINNSVLVTRGKPHLEIPKYNTSKSFYEYEGRLWLNNKIMSFWIYPTKKIFIKIIDELEKKLKIKIWDNNWKIEVVLNDTNKIITNYSYLKNFELTPDEQEQEYKNKHIEIIPIENFKKSEDFSDELKKFI